MKILKKQDVTGWKYNYTCANCESELEVEPKDLRHYHYDGDCREPGYDAYSAQCAVCSTAFTVPSTKIPKLLQIEVKDRTARYSTGYKD